MTTLLCMAKWRDLASVCLWVCLCLFSPVAATAQTGSLSGHVLRNADESPLPNAIVQLYRGEDPNIADEDAWIWVSSTTTDSGGLYSFSGLQERRYHVHVPGQNLSGSDYLEADLYEVQVIAGSETANMDLRLRVAGIIYGYVKTPAGDPIENAWLVADAAWTAEGNSWHNAWTNSAGRYEFRLPLSPGDFFPVWVREANRDGVDYASQWHGNLYRATVAGTSVPNYVLHPGGRVTGRVVNESGVGIAGVWVDVEGYPDIGPATETDASGYFSLRGVVPGINFIRLSNSWREIEQGGVKYMVGDTPLGPVDVPAGGTVDVGTFLVYEAGMVSGIVTDEAGLPIVGAEIDLDGRDINGDYAEREDQVTDAFGQYTMDYVAPGTYRLSCRKDGFLPRVETSVRVARGEHVEKDLILRGAAEGATVRGKITNYAAIRPYDTAHVPLPLYSDSDYDEYGYPDFGLLAFPMEGEWTVRDFLDPDNRFLGDREQEDMDDGYGDYFQDDPNEIPGRYADWFLPPGDVVFCMHHDLGENPGGMWSVTVNDYKRLNLSRGDVRTDVDFTCEVPASPGALHGQLNVPPDYNNFPEDWCMIYAFRLDAGGNVVNSMPLGDAFGGCGFTRAYELEDLAPGQYMLRAYARNLANVTIPVVTVNTDRITTQNITFTSGGTIAGQVTDGGGGVAGAVVVVVETGDETSTDASGNYAIVGLNTGTYTVVVSASGYADGQATVSVVEAAQSDQDFVLSATVGSISGTVKESDGTNVNGATVLAYNETDGSQETCQTVAGAFTAEGLTPGDYILGVDTDRHGVVVYPSGLGRIALGASQNVTGVDIVVGTPEPPLFSANSSLSDTVPAVLSVEFYSDQDLSAAPTVTVVDGNGVLGGLVSNTALNRFEIAYTSDPNDDLARLRIQETSPLVPGFPADQTFGFEVGGNLVMTSTTNVTNALGGTARMMGAQDNTRIYVPPFAIAGVDSNEAIPLTIRRYGDPGDAVAGDPNQTVTAVYDFRFEADGVEVDQNHTFTVTMSFELPAGMTQEEFEDSLTLKYFDAGEQRWKTDGISNVRINWVNKTVTFEVSHLTQFAGFVGEFEFLLHDWNGDGIISIVGDVPPFVNCVYFANCPDWPPEGLLTVGDCSGDGIISIIGDVPCFVDCVYFQNCPE